MRSTMQGKYPLKNPSKYLGDPTNVVYRSSWELRAMVNFDTNPTIVAWGSEEIIISYFWEGDNKFHRYFPDFFIVVKSKSGEVKKVLIEVKPYAQTQEPKHSKRKRKTTIMNEAATYSKNLAKWEAARSYCQEKGFLFLILTEHDLFKNGKAW